MICSLAELPTLSTSAQNNAFHPVLPPACLHEHLAVVGFERPAPGTCKFWSDQRRRVLSNSEILCCTNSCCKNVPNGPR